MSRITIPVAVAEFDEGGHTMWVHNRKGMTVLRIKCTGKIEVHHGCNNPSAHADMIVPGGITVCIPDRRKTKAKK